MKKFLIMSSILMSIVFAGENDPVEEQRVPHPYLTQEINEPVPINIQPNTIPDPTLARFIKERLVPETFVMIQVDADSYTIKFIEEIQPNSNWINVMERRMFADRTGTGPRLFKAIVDWRKISFIENTVPEVV